jgi:hypothetical protein
MSLAYAFPNDTGKSIQVLGKIRDQALDRAGYLFNQRPGNNRVGGVIYDRAIT